MAAKSIVCTSIPPLAGRFEVASSVLWVLTRIWPMKTVFCALAVKRRMPLNVAPGTTLVSMPTCQVPPTIGSLSDRRQSGFTPLPLLRLTFVLGQAAGSVAISSVPVLSGSSHGRSEELFEPPPVQETENLPYQSEVWLE